MNYLPFNKFLLRTHLFPFETLISFDKDSLKENSNDKIFLEAIFLATPVLFEELQKWKAGKITLTKEIKRIEYSLLRYYIRMSTRCTPFGLFAGCTVGEITKENSSIILSPLNQNKRNTRLDMNYLCALIQELAQFSEIKSKLKYFPNSSIYQLGQKIRYVEYHYKDTHRKHHLVAVDNSEYLQIILNKAQNGIYIQELVELLISCGINEEQSKNFIEELISSQLLISELEPTVTGEDLLEQIISILDGIKGIEEIKSKLYQIHSTLRFIDNSAIGLPIAEYKNVISIIESVGIKFEAQYLFQTDMIKPALKCTFKKQIAEDVLRGIEVLNKLTPKSGETNITRFRDAFYERYEGQDISLCAALDTESGIGYIQGSQDAGDISPLVDDVYTPKINEDFNIKWTSVQSLLFNKCIQSIKENKTEIELTDEDLKLFKADWNDLPETIAAMIQIYNDKIFLSSASGQAQQTCLAGFVMQIIKFMIL